MTSADAPDRAPGPTPLERAAPGLDRCVHCGFCLPACPTYLALEDENDSPRGRLLLMRGVVEGVLSLRDRDVASHLDQCLGCRACETACPSGVPYGHLLEAARETQRRQTPGALPVVGRILLSVFGRASLTRLSMAVARAGRAIGLARLFSKTPGRLGFAAAMLHATRPFRRPASTRPSGNGSGPTVGLLTGCVMEGLFGPTNRATERTLQVNGYTVVPVAGQRCCGALHLHAGDADTARQLARANIAAFERAGVNAVAVNASGCGAAMKEYQVLLADDPTWRDRATAFATKVRDVSELLAAVGPRPGGRLAMRVTYDAPCHLVHAQRVVDAPRRILEAIPGLTLIPLVDADACCGSAGIFNLTRPDLSAAVLAPKLERITETGADLVATGNPGCLMQIGAGLQRRGSRMRAVHPVDLLDASYASLDTDGASS